MSLKALCVFALIGAAIAQQSGIPDVPPASDDDRIISRRTQPTLKLPAFDDDDTTTKKVHPTAVLPAFEDDDVSDNVSVTNVVIPMFEDDDETDKPAVAGSSVDDEDDNEHGFPTLPESATPAELVAENTEDLSPEVTTAASAATQTSTRRPRGPSGLSGLFDIFGNAAHEVVNENANNFNNGIDAVLGIGQSFLHAANSIRDAKMIAAASIPRGWQKVFKALESQ